MQGTETHGRIRKHREEAKGDDVRLTHHTPPPQCPPTLPMRLLSTGVLVEETISIHDWWWITPLLSLLSSSSVIVSLSTGVLAEAHTHTGVLVRVSLYFCLCIPLGILKRALPSLQRKQKDDLPLVMWIIYIIHCNSYKSKQKHTNFWYIKKTRTWNGMEQKCRTNGGHTIHTHGELYARNMSDIIYCQYIYM